MTRKRHIGSVAAIGGMTATIGLLTCLATAKADELADLRANQELLQRRIDQLAQMQPGEPRVRAPGLSPLGTQPTPGAPLIGGSFPRSFLIPGTNTSIRVGGQADLTIDYWLQNGPANSAPQTTTVGNNGQALSQPLDIHGQSIPVPGAGYTGVPGVNRGNVVPPPNIQHSRGNGVFSMSPRETRLNVETRTPTAYGEARTFVEFDFINNPTGNATTHVSNNLTPRLRFAYGTLGGLLAGQANSNFADPDANPETLDFGGDVGQGGVVRIPQVRYTYAGPWGSAWSASLETPETDIITPRGQILSDLGAPGAVPTINAAGACIVNGSTFVGGSCGGAGVNPTKSSAPDITFASYWSQPWGHVDFRGVIRPTLQVMDGAFVNKQFVGYGGGISGDVKPGWLGWTKDDITWQVTAGTAIGRYLNEGDNAALSTNFTTTTQCATPTGACQGLLAASNIIAKPVPAVGISGGYQHWWLPNLRSNVTFGVATYAYSSQLLGPAQAIQQNKQVVTSHVNLIWSPAAFIDTGIEYMWGQRQTVANIFAKEQALIGKFRVKF